MPTYADILRTSLTRKFVGRQQAQDVFLRRLEDGSLSDFLILNIHGQTGMGKSFLLLQFAALAESDHIPVVGVSAQRHNTPWLVLQELYSQLLKLAPQSSAVHEIGKILERLDAIETKYHRVRATALREDAPEPHRRAKVGETVGGLIGSATGIPLLPIVGSGIGSLIGSKMGKAEVLQLFQGASLKDDEIQFCLGFGSRLLEATVTAINELAVKRKAFVLTIDVFEQVTPAVDEWIRIELLPNLEASVVIVIAGRIELQRLEGWDQYLPIIRQIELAPFTEAESVQFWKLFGLEDKIKAQTLHEVTGGHPFVSGLLADIRHSRQSAVAGDIEYLVSLRESSLIIEQLLRRFTTEFLDSEFSHLMRACAVPRWFDRGLLEAVIGPEVRELFDRIAGLSFVIRNRDGSFSLHELARDALLTDAKILDPDWVSKLHKDVADQLAARRRGAVSAGTQYISNELYHRLRADEHDGLKFGQGVLRSMKNLGARASLDPIVAEIADFPFSTRDGQMWRMYCASQESLRRGDWNTASRHLDELLHQPDLAADLSLWVTECRATILVGRGEYGSALTLQELVIQQLTNLGGEVSYSEITEAYYRLIETCGILSKFDDADSYFTQAMSLVGADPPSRARLLLARAACHRFHGTIEDGLTAAKEAASIYKAAGDPRPIAFSLIQLSRLLIHDGSWAEAERCLQEAADLEVPAPYEYDVGNIFLFRGNIYRRRQSWAQALDFYERALNIHQRIGSLREIGPLYGNLGVVQYALGNRQLAKKYLSDSLRVKEGQGYSRGVGITLKYMGDGAITDDDLDLARSHYRRAIAIADELDIRYLRPWARIGLARVDLLAGDVESCRQALAEDVLETEFAELRSTAKLYYLLAVYLLGGTGEDHKATAIAAMADGMRYNPHTLYQALDLIDNDCKRLDDQDGSLRSFPQGYWETLNSAANDDDLGTLERRERRREGLGSSIALLTDRLATLIQQKLRDDETSLGIEGHDRSSQDPDGVVLRGRVEGEARSARVRDP